MAALDLCGPECLKHRDLLGRVAALHGKAPRILSIPTPLARFFAGAMERFTENPPITRPMLEILQHDDQLDETSGCEQLGITLTPLSKTLRDYMGPNTGPNTGPNSGPDTAPETGTETPHPPNPEARNYD